MAVMVTGLSFAAAAPPAVSRQGARISVVSTCAATAIGPRCAVTLGPEGGKGVLKGSPFLA